MEAIPGFIEFYVSLVTYTVLHMIFVISSDFVEAFNIPPLNIGIYVDKLAAIRALLMVIADIVEWQILDKALQGSFDNKMAKSLSNQKDNPRRIGSIVSFIGMFACRLAYLIIVYKSDNKSLSVFITLCIEGFLFGVFQMSFFAIGPEYNALTSLGIHTMGNFIFFLQLILNKLAKKYPGINSLYRVRAHGWVCLGTSFIALCCWLYFCIKVDAKGEDAPSEWPEKDDVWSPFLLFIIGAFAEDFSVPGILPFAFLDPEKANLVNYLTPVFFMSGAIVTVFANDFLAGDKGLAKSLGLGLKDLGFKDWSSMSYTNNGKIWHSLWLLNIPKYIAFFIAMWSVHGTFADLRCIIQSRWRVLVLTLTVVVPRATLETAGYVGVANYAIGRADFGLVESELNRSFAKSLRDQTGISDLSNLTANNLRGALNDSTVKEKIADWVNFKYWSSISKNDIGVQEETAGTDSKVKVVLTGSKVKAAEKTSTQTVTKTGQKNVKVTITIDDENKRGILKKSDDNDGDNTEAATDIANKIAAVVALAALAKKLKEQGITSTDSLNADKLFKAINTGSDVKNAIAQLVNHEFPKVSNVTQDKISAEGTNPVIVKVKNATSDEENKLHSGTAVIVNGSEVFSLVVKFSQDLFTSGEEDEKKDKAKENASKLALRIKDAAMAAADKEGRSDAKSPDFGGFAYIAYHDILAMFCRFVYVKFAVGYNWKWISLLAFILRLNWSLLYTTYIYIYNIYSNIRLMYKKYFI